MSKNHTKVINAHKMNLGSSPITTLTINLIPKQIMTWQQ
uniref:Uncharacterized protein n=1 Tax=Rhizophora mucronata TaxID=61149 RepID=A0A2P2Q7Y1_RHIMU